jgi:glycyl-tRNA synthetase beta subunit
MYGVDMAYTAINNQTQTSINILKVTKSLSQQLGLESIYESNKYVEKFESNLENVDSVSAIIGDLFAETDAFLKDNDKLDLTLLSFAGGWTESVYIAASLARNNKNKAIMEMVGDQLVSLNPLIKLLGENQKNHDFKPLIKQLNEAKSILESGIVTPETETEPMVFEMDNKKLDELIKKLKEIRSKVENA